MGFLSKLFGGAVKTTVGTVGTGLNVVDETLKGDFEYEDTRDCAETAVDGAIDIITSPLAIFDDEDDD